MEIEKAEIITPITAAKERKYHVEIKYDYYSGGYSDDNSGYYWLVYIDGRSKGKYWRKGSARRAAKRSIRKAKRREIKKLSPLEFEY